MDIASNLDNVLLFYGCKLRNNLQFVKVPFLCVFYVTNVNIFITVFVQLFIYHNYSTFHIVQIFFPCACIYIHAKLLYKKPLITQLLRNIQAHTHADYIRTLARKWKFCVAVLITHYAIEVTVDILDYVIDPNRSDWHNEMLHFNASNVHSGYVFAYKSVEMFNQNTWFFATFLIYYYITHCLHQVHKTFFEKTLKSSAAVNLLRNQWRDVIDIRSQFEQSFSHMPFLWYANVFLRSMHYVTNIKLQKYELNYFTLLVLYWFASKLAYTFAIVFTIDYVNTDLQKMFSKLNRQLLGNDESDAFDKLKQDIEQNLMLKLTGSGFFELNKYLLLGFVSAVVSFSVLYIQLY